MFSSVVMWLLLAPPAFATAIASDAGDSAITGGAALGAGLIATGGAVLLGRQARRADSRAADDAQLRVVRRQAADDIKAVGQIGADLEKAVSKLLESAGMSPDSRSQILAKSAELDSQLEFIWDDEFRERMTDFARFAREAATSEGVGKLRARAVAADEAWRAARSRAGVVWRDLMRAVVDVDVLPNQGRPAGDRTGASRASS